MHRFPAPQVMKHCFKGNSSPSSIGFCLNDCVLGSSFKISRVYITVTFKVTCSVLNHSIYFGLVQ